MLQQHSAAALTVLALAGGAFAGMTALKAQNAGVGTALVDRYVAALNNHDLGAFAEVIADRYVQHNGRAGQGLAGTQATFKSYFETFPDMHVKVEKYHYWRRQSRRSRHADGNPHQAGAARTWDADLPADRQEAVLA